MSTTLTTPRPSNQTPYITLVIAPGIPESERKALEKHYKEAERDPAYTVVLNYEARVDLIEIPAKAKVFVVAPGIPASELMALSKKITKATKAKKQEDRLVVVNYECRIDTIAPTTD